MLKKVIWITFLRKRVHFGGQFSNCASSKFPKGSIPIQKVSSKVLFPSFGGGPKDQRFPVTLYTYMLLFSSFFLCIQIWFVFRRRASFVGPSNEEESNSETRVSPLCFLPCHLSLFVVSVFLLRDLFYLFFFFVLFFFEFCCLFVVGLQHS